jgi:serine protease inhibitor ecotin
LGHVPDISEPQSSHGFSWVVSGWGWLGYAMDQVASPMGSSEGPG